MVCDGQAFLVDVTIPGHTAAISPSPITQVQKAGDERLVLASFSSLTAISPQGQAWTSERLCLDDLRILDADEHTISCSGSFLEGSEEFTVETHAGQHQAGRRFLDSWPGI